MAVANVVLNTKTYAYSSDQAGIITWLDKSGGIPTGFQKLTAKITDSQTVDTPIRISWQLYKPVVAAVDSACTCTGEVLRTSSCRILIEESANGTSAERTDLGLSIKDLAADTQFQAMVTALTRPG